MGTLIKKRKATFKKLKRKLLDGENLNNKIKNQSTASKEKKGWFKKMFFNLINRVVK